MQVRTRLESGSRDDTARTAVRALCAVVVLIQAVVGVGLYRQWGWMIDRWPLPDARMTFIFYASIMAAIAAPLAWAAWRDELGVLEAIGFELMFGAPVVGLYLGWLAVDRRDGGLAGFALVSFALGAGMALLWRWAGQVPLRDPRPLPVLYRASFAGFCCVLVVIGGALALQVGDVFPWQPTPENGTIFGFIFLGAALLFAWIVAHPRWAYGEMALTSFLAYDLVLAVPYIDLLRQRDDAAAVSSYYGGDPAYAVAPGDNGINELSLTIYLSVLAISALLAVSMYMWGLRLRPVEQAAPAQ